jgi:hypothetical protein
MSEKKTIDPQKILIREFKITKGKIDCPDEFDVHNIGSFSYNANLDTGFNLDQKLIRADLSVNVSTISKEKSEEANGSFHLVFIYYFEDLPEHSKLSENGAVDWNPYLANAIASITYSTSRGILISRFQGTVMRDFILPVVDPNTLVAKKLDPENELK